jgi:hypothetical protein
MGQFRSSAWLAGAAAGALFEFSVVRGDKTQRDHANERAPQ